MSSEEKANREWFCLAGGFVATCAALAQWGLAAALLTAGASMILTMIATRE